ncbi:MAG: hypothetical protein LBF92_08900 [Synergistaceae bacterium]|jgi:hypothetical protein|nr:hypothetical protein [Synergistaceae bacterium]
MASIKSMDGRLAFKTDTGERNGVKPVYRTVGLGRIAGGAPVEALGAVASDLKELLEFPTVIITLHRVDELTL